MTTPVLVTNWGMQSVSTLGGGICNGSNGTACSIDTAVYRNAGSPQSLKCTTSSSVGFLQYSHVSGAGVIVGRFYIYFPSSLPTAGNKINLIAGYGNDATWAEITFNPADSKLYAMKYGENGTAASFTCSPNTWYCIDFRFDWSGTTHTIDWSIDGVAQTQYSKSSEAATTFQYLRIGNTGGVTSTGTWHFSDLVLSVTSGDYPIGEGGTQTLVPSADGTHNAGANTIEANDGTNIGVTTAYDKISSIPASASAYIRQSANGADNYAEVLFGNISATRSGIIGAQAVLCYTSETTTANKGACIVSKDDLSTSTTIWGAPGATADYSDGNISTLYYKSAIVAGVTDDTKVNALKARLGYSDDANPDPYWIGLAVEVAYTTSNQITGSLSATLANATLSAAGKVEVQGSLSNTLEHATATGTGKVEVRGSLSATLEDTTAIGTGTVEVQGPLSATLEDTTGVGTGTVEVQGSLSATLEDATATAAGKVSVSGSLSATLENATLTGAGAVDITGSLSVVLDGTTLSAAGVVGNAPATGSLSATLDDTTATGTGTVEIAGALSATLADTTLTGAGLVDVRGSLSAALDDATLSGTGKVDISGSLSGTLEDTTLSAEGSLGLLPISGSLSITLEGTTATGTGAVDISGSLCATLENTTANGAGQVSISGALSTTLEDTTVDGQGAVTVAGSLSVTLDETILAAVGNLGELETIDVLLSVTMATLETITVAMETTRTVSVGMVTQQKFSLELNYD